MRAASPSPRVWYVRASAWTRARRASSSCRNARRCASSRYSSMCSSCARCCWRSSFLSAVNACLIHASVSGI
ncbi:MAG: hypothetical protein CYG59_11540 [Chloroflexi bacterium]|nr:MAG: hypothetical protein CYG59_11540 [Chloroflexota bacterium]